MRAIRGSHQRPAYGCSNLFQTNLSLTCRLPAIPSGLGITLIVVCYQTRYQTLKNDQKPPVHGHFAEHQSKTD